MKKISKYKILPEHRLMIECYTGETDINSIIDFKRIIIEDKDYNPGFNF